MSLNFIFGPPRKPDLESKYSLAVITGVGRDPDELMVCPACKEWTTVGDPCCGIGGLEDDDE